MKKFKSLRFLKYVFLVGAVLQLVYLIGCVSMQIVEIISIPTLVMIICPATNLIAFYVMTRLMKKAICDAVIDYTMEVLKKENVDKFQIKCSYMDHNKEYLNFRIVLKAKISEEIYSRCCTAISEYLESIEPILKRETYMTMEVF